MATFFTVDMLRAHVVRAVPPVTFGNPGNLARPRPMPRPRPVLTAHWLVAAEGRLTCRWQTKVSAAFGPPPD
jgi:hypothetical protein